MEQKVKITKCPPGRAEGAYFQRYSLDRNFGRAIPLEVNPSGETPQYATLAEDFSRSAMSLRELAEMGEGD